MDVSRETTALPRPPRPRTIVIANQKGGVGKTTTAVNVAAGLALGGLRVLVVDMDPQGNATTALGIEHPEGMPGTYEALVDGVPLEDVMQRCPDIDGLWVIPATIDLAGAEIGLVAAVSRETKLRTALDAFLRGHHVDYILLDCPPSLGLLTLNALVAAQEIMIPIQCEYYALEGVTQLLRTIDLVKGRLNDALRLSTVLLTMYDARTNLSAQVAEQVRTHFPQQTLEVAIPRSVRVAEAPSYGQTVLSYHLASAGAQAYLKAAHEIAARGAAN
nr:ParA family protein [Propionibacterium sp.]